MRAATGPLPQAFIPTSRRSTTLPRVSRPKPPPPPPRAPPPQAPSPKKAPNNPPRTYDFRPLPSSSPLGTRPPIPGLLPAPKTAPTVEMSDREGYYQTLNIVPTSIYITASSDRAASKTLNDAKIALLRLYHPDANKDEGGAAEKLRTEFHKVADAYDKLDTRELDL